MELCILNDTGFCIVIMNCVYIFFDAVCILVLLGFVPLDTPFYIKCADKDSFLKDVNLDMLRMQVQMLIDGIQVPEHNTLLDIHNIDAEYRLETEFQMSTDHTKTRLLSVIKSTIEHIKELSLQVENAPITAPLTAPTPMPIEPYTQQSHEEIAPVPISAPFCIEPIPTAQLMDTLPEMMAHSESVAYSEEVQMIEIELVEEEEEDEEEDDSSVNQQQIFESLFPISPVPSSSSSPLSEAITVDRNSERYKNIFAVFIELGNNYN